MYGPIPRFVVVVSSAKMPSSCWGRYGKVAVIETDGVHMPSRIAPRDKSCVAIKFLRDRQFWGKSDTCALRKSWDEAERYAAELNLQQE